MVAQSCCENGAPNWPPWLTWSSVRPLGRTDGRSTVVTRTPILALVASAAQFRALEGSETVTLRLYQRVLVPSKTAGNAYWKAIEVK